MLALFALDVQMVWNVVNVDITGDFSFSSINNKMMVKLKKADKNNKDLQICFLESFFYNIVNSSV